MLFCRFGTQDRGKERIGVLFVVGAAWWNCADGEEGEESSGGRRRERFLALLGMTVVVGES